MEHRLHKTEPQISEILVDTVNYFHILLGFSWLLILYFILISQRLRKREKRVDVSGDGGGGNTEETREWLLPDTELWKIGRASVAGRQEIISLGKCPFLA